MDGLQHCLISHDVPKSRSEGTIPPSILEPEEPVVNVFSDRTANSPGPPDELDTERVGVFDYIASSSPLRNNKFYDRAVSPVANKYAEGSTVEQRDWVQDVAMKEQYDETCEDGTELTTFRSSVETVKSGGYAGEQMVNGGNDSRHSKYIDDDDDELQEVVTQADIQPQRVAYQRYDPGPFRVYDPRTLFIAPIKAEPLREPSEERITTDRSSRAGSQQSDGSSHEREHYISHTDYSQVDYNPGMLNPSPVPPQKVFYLNELLRSGSLATDASDERYIPRSEVGRRLFRNRQKKEARKAEVAHTTLAQEVAEYKGELSLEELLAFINNTPTASPCEKSSDATSPGVGKERNTRRKKRLVLDDKESGENETASSSNKDFSSCSSLEGLAAGSDDVSLGVSKLPDNDYPVIKPSPRSEDASVDLDQNQFVIVTKKKKVPTATLR